MNTHMMKKMIRGRLARQGGMILILVSAVLVLLAVIGTIFLVVARVNKQSARDASTQENMSFAQQSVLNIVRSAILQSTLDSTGVVMGNNANNPPYNVARTWDYGEWNPNAANTMQFNQTAWSPTTPTAQNPATPSEPWLVHCLPWEPNCAYAAGAEVEYDGVRYQNQSTSPIAPSTTPPPGGGWTAVTTTSSPSAVSPLANSVSLLTDDLYDPETGIYDLQPTGTPLTMPDASVIEPNGSLDSLTPAPAAVGGSLDGVFNLLPYSSASGVRYRYAVVVVDTNSMANLNVGDPYSVGAATSKNNAQVAPDLYGQYLTGVPLCDPSIFNTTTMGTDAGAAILAGAYPNFGREGANSAKLGAYYPAVWQPYVMNFETGAPAGYPPLPPQWFSLSDELGLRSYGEMGYYPRDGFPTSVVRAQQPGLWPANLDYQQPGRSFYTTYSWDRTICNKTAYSLYTLNGLPTATLQTVAMRSSGEPAAAMPVIPFPAQANMNGEIDRPTGNNAATDVGPEQTALVATQLAAAMQNSGYQPAQEIAAAANYAAYRYDGGAITGAGYGLPIGPSFIDSQGICVRGYMSSSVLNAGNFAGANDLRTLDTAGSAYILPPLGRAGPVSLPFAPTVQNSKDVIYSGFAAQPFIVAVEASVEKVVPTTKGATPYVKVQDWAVELYNPFPEALDLSGWKLKFFDGGSGTYPAGGGPNGEDEYPLPSGTSIPANGYLLVMQSGGTGLTPPSGTASLVVVNGGGPTGVVMPLAGPNSTNQPPQYVVLTRPFTPRVNSGSNDLPVDAFLYAFSNGKVNSGFVQAQAGYKPNAYVALSVARTTDTTNQWWEAVATDQEMAGSMLTPVPSSGVPAAPVGAVPQAIPMYDRFVQQFGNPFMAASPMPVPGQALVNIGDFNHITRLGAICALNPVGNADKSPDYVPVQMITEATLGLPNTAPDGALGTPDGNIHLQYEANARFDFADAPSASNVSILQAVDPRAQALLGLITFVDRYNDPSVTVDGSPTSLNKLRIPGRINVNTASPDVLADLYSNMTNAAIPRRQMVADTVALRGRTTFAYSDANGAATASFIKPTLPQLAIQNMGQLLTAFIYGSTPKQVPLTLDMRDQEWAAIYNFATVRSDTFVVYGYIEALEQNPYAPHDNRYDWYPTTSASNPNVTDDPTGLPPTTAGTTAPPAYNIRVGKRRFVAIIDRSYCNGNQGAGNFELPRVVALKVLPN